MDNSPVVSLLVARSQGCPEGNASQLLLPDCFYCRNVVKLYSESHRTKIYSKTGFDLSGDFPAQIHKPVKNSFTF